MDRKIDMNTNKIQLHPEESGVDKLNSSFKSISFDVERINSLEKDLAININNLMTNTVNRLNTVKQNINNEKERLQDISMLCNKYTDFNNTALINKDDFSGSFDYNDGVYSLESLGVNTVQYKISSVYGNGYEGNKYVLGKNSYLENTLRTDNRKAIFDNSIATYWEYSRINASNTEEYLINDFNTDTEEAKCTVKIEAKEEVNEIKIVSEDKELMITGIQYSNNDVDYKSIDIGVIAINNKESMYRNSDYIYGSGLIALPNCKYIKLTFQSNSYTDDIIAYDRKIIDEDTNKVNTATTVVKSAKRHAIKINDIYCYKKTYKTNSVMQSKELITTDNVYAIALHCNQLIPKELNKDYIEYVLTVNGIDYKVVPVNSHVSSGTKIIRFSQGKMSNDYVRYIGEEIKSAVLFIKIKGKLNITPYINNIKILIGGEI